MSDKQMFDQVYCSQCGGSFGPGYHGYSHCSDHTESALASQQKAADNIHTCSYYCTRPACIRAQRDELRDRLEAQQKAEPVAWQPVPLRACIKPTHEAADAFWKYWRENGETHKHGYYESTWGAINAALACGYAAPPLDPEGLRLLREALDWVGLDSPMFEKIDAYLAKYHSGPVVGVPSAQRDNAA